MRGMGGVYGGRAMQRDRDQQPGARATVSPMDPLPESPWSRPGTVAGFLASPPNATLLRFVEARRRGAEPLRILDIGGGAGRNAAPLRERGHRVLALDLSWPMLQAGMSRPEATSGSLTFAQASMDRLPGADRTFDIVIAHGIWNLARSGAEFRAAIGEAARVCRTGAGLFVFTFSRSTLPGSVSPVAGETFVFTEFSGSPQCFLTERELIDELAAVGFEPDSAVPVTEHNRPRPGQLSGGGPVIYEGAFRLTG